MIMARRRHCSALSAPTSVVGSPSLRAPASPAPLCRPAFLQVAQSMNNLAALLKNEGRMSEALPLYESALAVYEKVWPLVGLGQARLAGACGWPCLSHVVHMPAAPIGPAGPTSPRGNALHIVKAEPPALHY